MLEMALLIRAKRALDSEESEQWLGLKNREKTIRGLEKGFEDVLNKAGLSGFALKVKVSIK